VLDGRYRLLRKVGEGAMGEVFEAEHVTLRRRVAVKILRRHIAYQPEAIARLEREAQATSQIGHPNLVSMLDFGQTDDGTVYLAMEWLEGEDLDAYAERQPIDIATSIDIVSQAASGVGEANDRGVIHRDLKPANLFITRDRAGALRVKVLDFGIAKLAIEQTQLTGTGVLIGTPNYMSPEQALGEPVDVRTDVYALGVILYELLTGSVPFRGDSPIAVLHQHTSRMPAAPSAVVPGRGISHELDQVVLTCLAKSPADRYPSMHALLAALAGARRGDQAPTQAATDDDDDDLLMEAAGLRTRRRTILLVAIATLACGGVLALVLMFAFNAERPAIANDASGGDASVAATPIDGTAAVVDAVAAVAVDAGPPVTPVWEHEGHARGFHYRARIDGHEPRRDAPFDMAIELEDLNASIADAARRGTLRAIVKVEYFADHALVHHSDHGMGESLAIATRISAARAGKHHVHVELRDGTRGLGRASFDLLVGE